MNRPEVSVVMSVFNGEPFLAEALDCILAQEGVNLEFIIVDDGSTDGSPGILDDHTRRDPRVRVIRQPNRGLTRALIHGCAVARGEFIARQDCDDVSLPGRLARLAGMLRTDAGLSFVSSAAEVIGPAGETLLVHQRPTNPDEATAMLLSRQGGPPGHGSVMFRRAAYEQVGGYRQQMYFAQDSDLWLRLALVGGLSYAPEVLYKYRVAPDSISGRLHPLKLAYADMVTELHEARLAGRDEFPILERAAALRRQPDASGQPAQTSEGRTNYFIARCLIQRGDSRALSYLRHSLRDEPWFLRAWASLAQAAWLRWIKR